MSLSFLPVFTFSLSLHLLRYGMRWKATVMAPLIGAGGPGAQGALFRGQHGRAGRHICYCWQSSYDLPSWVLSSSLWRAGTGVSHTPALPHSVYLPLLYRFCSRLIQGGEICKWWLSLFCYSLQRQGRCDTFATEFDLEAEEYVPLPKGDVHKKKEIVQDVTLHDLDVANARPQVQNHRLPQTKSLHTASFTLLIFFFREVRTFFQWWGN